VTRDRSVRSGIVALKSYEGRAVHAQNGAVFEARRTLIEGNHDIGLAGTGPGTKLQLLDVVVRNTQCRVSDGENGIGLGLELEAFASVERGLFEGNHTAGIHVIEFGASAELADIAIRDTQGSLALGHAGRGLNVEGEAHVVVQRALLETNREVALNVMGQRASAVIEDLVVRDTRSNDSMGLHGRGVNVQGGAQVTIDRALFDANRETAATAFGPATALTMRDVTIQGTMERECLAAGTCEGHGVGDGVGSFGGAQVELHRFVVSGNRRCGIQLARGNVLSADGEPEQFELGGEVDLHDGVVSLNAIGINIQTEGFDSERLTDNVRFVENEVDLDASELFVPEQSF